MSEGRHIHLDDYSQTLCLLAALVGRRVDKERLGYSATEHGAIVDWERMVTGPLSSTEMATVHIARGLLHLGACRRAPAAPGRFRHRSRPGSLVTARRAVSRHPSGAADRASAATNRQRGPRSWAC